MIALVFFVAHSSLFAVNATPLPITEVVLNANGTTVTQTASGEGGAYSDDSNVPVYIERVTINDGGSIVVLDNFATTSLTIANVQQIVYDKHDVMSARNNGIVTASNNANFLSEVTTVMDTTDIRDYMSNDDNSQINQMMDIVYNDYTIDSDDYILYQERWGNSSFSVQALDASGNLIGQKVDFTSASYTWDSGYDSAAAPSPSHEQHQKFGIIKVAQFGVGATKIHGLRYWSLDADMKFYVLGVDSFEPLLKGHIYEDINADGSLEDKRALRNVEVLLYEGTTQRATTTTDASGLYSFDIPNGDYIIVVNSQTIGAANVWAEQTYAPKGGICSGNPLAVAGACFGGKEGSRNDDSSTLNRAEHRVDVTVTNTGVSDVDFGFSFNGVTNIEDAGQGSLRQFIINANELAGANVMRFSPAVPQNEASWWKITLESPLPMLTDPGTVIDGSTIDDENSGSVAHAHDGEEVGTDKIALPSFNKPELEINANNQAVNNFSVLWLSTNTTIKHIAIYNADYAGILASSGENIVISENFIGSRADGSEPEESQRLEHGIYHSFAERVKITNNFIAYINSTGIWARNNATITNNSLYKASKQPTQDAITTEYSESGSITIENNRIEGSSAYGIESWNSLSVMTIRNNTLIANGQDTSAGNESEYGGIRVFGANNIIEKNVIRNHKGAGVVIVGGEKGNTISQNSIYDNDVLGIDIDLRTAGTATDNRNGDGVNVNNGTLDATMANNEMDSPVLTVATISGNILHVKGYIGTEADLAIFKNSKVEVFISDSTGSGKSYLGQCPTSGDGNFECDITVLGELTVNNATILVATATGTDNSTSEFGENMIVSAGDSPFTCDDTMYFSNASPIGEYQEGMLENNMYLHAINREQSPFTFKPIGEAFPKTDNALYNALGYNPQDNLLYATLKNELLKIDGNGDVSNLGVIVGLAEEKQNYAGTFGHVESDSKAYYYLSDYASPKNLYKIDVATKTIVSTIKVKLNGVEEAFRFVDMTVDESGDYLYFISRGWLYHGTEDYNQLMKLELATGNVTAIGKEVADESEADSIYCDVTGRVFVLFNEGGFYELNPSTGMRTPISSAPKMAGLNDGAMCPNATVQLQPTIRLFDAEVIESNLGETALEFAYTLSSEGNFTVTVDALDGTDTDDSINAKITEDFSQTVTIMKNSLNGIISVPVYGDTIVEADEKMILKLSNLTGALYHDSVNYAIGTILNDDFDIKLNAMTTISGFEGNITTQIVNQNFEFTVKAYDFTRNRYVEDMNITKVEITDATGVVSTWSGAVQTDLTGSATLSVSVDRAVKVAGVTLYGDYNGTTYDNEATDNFAVRPDKFTFTLPAKVKAGESFVPSLKAVDVAGVSVEAYNEAITTSFDINYSEKLPQCENNMGSIDLSTLQFTDGVIPQDINYPEVGELDFNISEIAGSEFALVDENDTVDTDRFITAANASTVQFIAGYFDIESWSLTNGAPDFTYYANSTDIAEMSAELNATIKAYNLSGDLLKNYDELCYAKTTNLKISYNRQGETTGRLSWEDMIEGTVHNGIGNGSHFIFDINSSQYSNGGKFINFDNHANNDFENITENPGAIISTNSNVVEPNNVDSMKFTIPKAPFRDRITYEPDAWLLFNRFNETATKNSFHINITSESGWSGKGNEGLTIKGKPSSRSYKKMDW